VPLLNKLTYLHCSGEKIIDSKKGQIKQEGHKQGEKKIHKREVNASLEEPTSWKINLFSDTIGSKMLRIGDFVWLHHSERNATLAALRSTKAFDKSKFHSADIREWLALENLSVGVQPSGISESTYEQYVGKTYSMWIIESVEIIDGGNV
jgi:inositol 1,4,5-triphosphate receptor type 3